MDLEKWYGMMVEYIKVQKIFNIKNKIEFIIIIFLKAIGLMDIKWMISQLEEKKERKCYKKLIIHWMIVN